jgi:2,5-diamino-6-(ribosylamino)-4(3H)-pyrimidinone 5'-phosphate reductase
MMKPYVICHMCTTIDGKIIGERWGRLAYGRDSGTLFESTAATFEIPAWLVGTTTMREFAAGSMPLKAACAKVDHRDHLARRQASRFAFAADAKGVLRFKTDAIGGDHVVLLVTDRVSDAYLAHLRSAGVSYLFCGRERIDLPTALRKIRQKLGLRKLMLEGGGKFNGAMLQSGLIDEISQVIVPVLDGGASVASLCDVPGRATARAAASLRTIGHRVLPGGVHWLRYRVRCQPAEK